MTKPSNMLRPAVLAAAVAFAVAAQGAPAAAQTRIHQPALPDLELLEMLVPVSYEPGDYDEVDRLAWGAGASGATRPGEDGAIAGSHAVLRVGRRYARGTFVAARSELRGDATRDDGEDTTVALAGRHRALARVAIGDPTKGKFGADAGADVRVTHEGDRHVPLGPVRLLPGAYYDVYGEVTVAPRRGGKSSGPDAAALSLPITYGAGKTIYRDGGAVSRVERRAAAGAVDVRLYDRHAIDATLTLVGARVERRSFTGDPAMTAQAGAADPAFTGPAVESELISFDVTSIRGAFFVDEDLVITADFGYGGAKMTTTDARGLERSAKLFRIRYAGMVKGPTATVGFAASREGDITGDGSRLVADNRISLFGELRAGGFAGKVAGEAGWLREQDVPDERDRGRLGRYALHAEAWYELPRGIELGVYEVAALDTVDVPGASVPADPWERRRGWSVQMGGFVRIRGE